MPGYKFFRKGPAVTRNRDLGLATTVDCLVYPAAELDRALQILPAVLAAEKGALEFWEVSLQTHKFKS